jgi:hypothetical protein
MKITHFSEGVFNSSDENNIRTSLRIQNGVVLSELHF